MEAARLRFYGVGRRRRRESERKAKASARSDERRNERSEGLAGSVLSCRQRERPRETAVEPRAHSKRVSPLPQLSLSLSLAPCSPTPVSVFTAAHILSSASAMPNFRLKTWVCHCQSSSDRLPTLELYFPPYHFYKYQVT